MNMPDVIDAKSANERLLMHVLYGMHTAAWASMGSLALVAFIINLVKRSDETDPLYREHHDYMVRTFLWTIGWLVILSPLWLLFFLPGAIAYGLVGLWYLYRCIRGWLRFNKGRPAMDLQP